MLRHFVRAHWLLFVSLLFLTAVALTAARLWVPTLGSYQQELEAAASKALKREVTIGKLEATWRGLGPVLKLKKVAIEGAAGKRDRVHINEVWIRLDVDHYIAERKVRVSGIDVIGVELGITRDVDGRIFIEEFDQGAAGDNFDVDEFLKMQRLSVNDSIITFTDLQSGDVSHRFSDVTLALHSDGYERSVNGYAMLPPELGYRVDIAARLYGADANFGKWRGNAYMKGQVLALSDHLRSYLPDNMAVEGVADVRMWLDFSSAQLQSMQGEFDAHSIRLENSSEAQAQRFSAEIMRGTLGWRQVDDGWQLALQDFSLTQEGITGKIENISLSGLSAGDVNHLQLVSDHVPLDGLGALLTVLPGLATEQRKHLAAMQPAGTINDLQMALEYGPDRVVLNRFTAGFSALKTRQSGSYPSVSGISGGVSGTPAQGSLSLFGSAVGYHDNKLFSEPLTPFEILADIQWTKSADRLEVAIENLQLENRDVALHGEIGLDFPDSGLAPALNLKLAVKNADVGRIASYLPAMRMPARGVAWLQKSLVSGVVADGSIIINGRLDQIPFDNNEGQLEVSLPVKNVVLDYNKRWSPLVGLAAQVDIVGRSLDVRSNQGTIRTALVNDVHVHIPNLAKPVLALKGSLNGSLPVMLDELGSSPLGESYGSFVDRVQALGEAKLELDLDMVLHGKKKTVSVSGQIGLDENELAINDSDIVLKKITGRLDFDGKGIRSDKLAAEIYGKPVKVSVWSGERDKSTNISLDGKLGLLRQFVGRDSPLYASINGSSDWGVVLSIKGKPRRGKKASMTLHAGSMLVGTAIDLPPPFGKDGSTARELSIDVTRLAFPQKQVRISYGTTVNGLLSVAAKGQTHVLQKGAIEFGGGIPALPPEKRLLVSGRLPQVRTTDWKPYLDNGGKESGLPVECTLDVEELEVLGHKLSDVSLQMDSAGRVWDITAKGPSVSGDIQLTRSGAGLDKVVMTLDRLALQRDTAARPQQKTGAVPGSFPNLQIVTQQFSYDGIDLGNFQLTMARKPGNTLEITRLILSSELLDARLTGLWQLQDGQQRSSVDLEVAGGQMDALLKVFGFQESMEDGDLSGTMRAAWTGPPWAFSPPAVEGQISVLIENGQLVDLEPGAAGRILGLLSLTNIRRRLLLDFSDLFGEGFSFDRIEGEFVVEGGNAYTSDLYVKGPAAKIDITGRVGLAAQDYDQQVTVTPTVKTPLSLAGTLVGGPVVGAAIMVAETLLEGKIEAINKLVRTRYSITGPWSGPEIRKIEDIESESADSQQ